MDFEWMRCGERWEIGVKFADAIFSRLPPNSIPLPQELYFAVEERNSPNGYVTDIYLNLALAGKIGVAPIIDCLKNCNELPFQLSSLTLSAYCVEDETERLELFRALTPFLSTQAKYKVPSTEFPGPIDWWTEVRLWPVALESALHLLRNMPDHDEQRIRYLEGVDSILRDNLSDAYPLRNYMGGLLSVFKSGQDRDLLDVIFAKLKANIVDLTLPHPTRSLAYNGLRLMDDGSGFWTSDLASFQVERLQLLQYYKGDLSSKNSS